jgi:hypothetical protein
MSLTIPHSSALKSAPRLPTKASTSHAAAIIAAAVFFALFAAQLALVIALAPSVDALRDLAPLG